MIDKSQRRTSDALPNSLASAGCSNSLASLTRVWVLVLIMTMPTTNTAYHCK